MLLSLLGSSAHIFCPQRENWVFSFYYCILGILHSFQIKVPFLFSFKLGFKVKSSCFLSRCSVTWAMTASASRGSPIFVWGPPWTGILPPMVSCIAGTAGVHHHDQLTGWDGVLLTFCSGWPWTVILQVGLQIWAIVSCSNKSFSQKYFWKIFSLSLWLVDFLSESYHLFSFCFYFETGSYKYSRLVSNSLNSENSLATGMLGLQAWATMPSEVHKFF